MAEAVAKAEELDWPDRIANALSSYGWYLQKTFWPTDLAVDHPHPETAWTWGPVLGGAAALFIGTLLALAVWRDVPAALIGWLWFVGTLIPVIGLVQAGGQAMADRFAYVPHIGCSWPSSGRPPLCSLPCASRPPDNSAWQPLAWWSWRALPSRRSGTGAIPRRSGRMRQATEDNHRAHANLGSFYAARPALWTPVATAK